jgi:hypothetical protein
MRNKIEKALNASIDLLLEADADMLLVDVNERTISHKFAEYLEPYFPDWNIDCEYNRDGHEPKRLDIVPRNVMSDDTEVTTVYPDIIVHRRGTQQNLLVIEMKKTTSRENDDYHFRKLRAYKRQLAYRFAVFIKIGTGDQNAGIPEIVWVNE